MSADLLRRAATQARSEAENHLAVAPILTRIYGDDCGSGMTARRALAVADWLDAEAALIAQSGRPDAGQVNQNWPALVVARTYLGAAE